MFVNSSLCAHEGPFYMHNDTHAFPIRKTYKGKNLNLIWNVFSDFPKSNNYNKPLLNLLVEDRHYNAGPICTRLS